MKEIDIILEKYREEKRVRCPYCNHDNSNDRNGYDMYEAGIPMTYHGWPDEEDKNIECFNCGEEFKVREHVRRTYTTCKLDEEFE